MRYEELFSTFPELLREILEEWKLNRELLQEIRIRAGRPVLAVCRNREYQSVKTINRTEMKEILACLSNYSLYACEDELCQGFLSLPGGHRVGVAGRTVMEGGRIRTMTDVSSLNIRVAREVKGCADYVLPCLWERDRLLHTLIVSAPGCGKTTLLRDCIRQISDGAAGHAGMTVGVVDERSEIAGSYRGVPENDLGMRTDVLDGCPKAEGMMLLIRSMAPKVVAVDEVGSSEDLHALASAMNCGCVLLATVHAARMEELKTKPVLREMVKTGMFERYVFLEPCRVPGKIRQILDRDERPVSGKETGC
ncbi:MAG: stage III sporulation protein AA [Lachnospiraceae bacterium]|jgi:stage III sporulation protein AA|nr:stage III sporulation protein AA [Lachnospiraceae bacterium]MCI9599647.1 stage III sporulation protein AA [Lachnospiraceae bacterium]